MGRVRQVSTISGDQRTVEAALGDYLKQMVGKTATPYSGQLVADIPEMFTDAYGRLQSMLGNYGDVVRSALLKDVEGVPAWQMDMGNIKGVWEKEFATPMMETWRSTVAPMLREEFASIPGGLYSQARGRGIRDEANRFFGEYVQPTYWQGFQAELGRMFSSTEAAAGRSAPAALALTGLPKTEFDVMAGPAQQYMGLQQQGLTAAYQDFLRTSPESSPWMQLAMQYMGIPTYQAVTVGGDGGSTDWMGVGAGAGVGALMANAGMLGTMGAGSGAALGALAAFSDVRVKTNIAPIESALSKVARLKGYTFEFVGSNTRSASIMAQDLETVLPEGVSEVDGVKCIHIPAVVALLVDAVNELSEETHNG